MDIRYPVACPLMGGEEITGEVCFDIHSVVDAGAPKWSAPSKAMNTPNFEQICRECPYHRDD